MVQIENNIEKYTGNVSKKSTYKEVLIILLIYNIHILSFLSFQQSVISTRFSMLTVCSNKHGSAK